MSAKQHTQPPSTSSQGPPNWLFSNNSNNSSISVSSKNTTPTMAKKSQKATKPVGASKSAASSSAGKNQAPPDQLMDLVESFLSDQGFDNAHREFQKHREKKGWKSQNAGKQKDKTHHSLVSVFQTWETFSSQANTPVIPKDDPIRKITKVSSSSSSSDSDSSDESSSESSSSSDSDSDSDDSKDVAMADAPVDDESSSSESSSSDDSDSDSDSESDSDSDDEKETAAKKTTGIAKNGGNPLKRKAASDSESSSESDSDDDMSDSSSEDERPQTKKAKTKASSDESSSSSSSESSNEESSDDEDDNKAKKSKRSQVNDESSSSESDSDSDSDSDSSDSKSDEEPKVDLKAAAAVPLPESDSSSDSSSESEDEKPERPSKGPALNGAGSDTSVTLDKASPEFTSASYPPLPPDPVTSKANNRGKNGAKAQNQPFSRIRKDITIDPRLSSNAYVSHGYGEKAHQDLIVTKGKGFTKEKNKKKRGSYKGGPLDIHNSRSIKFED
ncbi:hypothetical protein K445DRAFT_320165 [Daldinia sp. EC12]|nr:hypothetical protein K445DRAFT_320165 [Daldinia sp. EC12]